LLKGKEQLVKELGKNFYKFRGSRLGGRTSLGQGKKKDGAETYFWEGREKLSLTGVWRAVRRHGARAKRGRGGNKKRPKSLDEKKTTGKRIQPRLA